MRGFFNTSVPCQEPLHHQVLAIPHLFVLWVKGKHLFYTLEALSILSDGVSHQQLLLRFLMCQSPPLCPLPGLQSCMEYLGQGPMGDALCLKIHIIPYSEAKHTDAAHAPGTGSRAGIFCRGDGEG